MSALVASAVPSPCRNICRVQRGLCTGCGRTLEEISRWPTATDDQKRAILAAVRARKPQ